MAQKVLLVNALQFGRMETRGSGSLSQNGAIGAVHWCAVALSGADKVLRVSLSHDGANSARLSQVYSSFVRGSRRVQDHSPTMARKVLFGGSL